MSVCCAASAMIQYPNGKYWLMQLLIPSIFAFERQNPIDFAESDSLCMILKYLLMGKKFKKILNLHCCKPKATAVDLLCNQNWALSLIAEVPPSLWMSKYTQSFHRI